MSPQIEPTPKLDHVSLVSNTKSTVELFLTQEKLFGASCKTVMLHFNAFPQQFFNILSNY